MELLQGPGTFFFQLSLTFPWALERFFEPKGMLLTTARRKKSSPEGEMETHHFLHDAVFFLFS